MPRLVSLRLLFALAALLGVSAASVHAAGIMVFAAASLSDALQDVARAYQTAGGDAVRFSFASSSVLARQIKEGAPADLFFSADEAKMDDLEKNGLIAPGTRRSLLSNTLVIVVHAEDGAAVATPVDLGGPAVRRLALAEPHTVPAGIYARAWLLKTGLWEKIAAKVVAMENVRACLSAVESGNADAGLVYKTDALTSKQVKVACEVAAADGPKISYPLAVVKETRHEEKARKFAAYLASPAARAIFEKYGFLPVP